MIYESEPDIPDLELVCPRKIDAEAQAREFVASASRATATSRVLQRLRKKQKSIGKEGKACKEKNGFNPLLVVAIQDEVQKFSTMSERGGSITIGSVSCDHSYDAEAIRCLLVEDEPLTKSWAAVKSFLGKFNWWLLSRESLSGDQLARPFFFLWRLTGAMLLALNQTFDDAATGGASTSNGRAIKSGIHLRKRCFGIAQKILLRSRGAPSVADRVVSTLLATDNGIKNIVVACPRPIRAEEAEVELRSSLSKAATVAQALYRQANEEANGQTLGRQLTWSPEDGGRDTMSLPQLEKLRNFATVSLSSMMELMKKMGFHHETGAYQGSGSVIDAWFAFLPTAMILQVGHRCGTMVTVAIADNCDDRIVAGREKTRRIVRHIFRSDPEHHASRIPEIFHQNEIAKFVKYHINHVRPAAAYRAATRSASPRLIGELAAAPASRLFFHTKFGSSLTSKQVNHAVRHVVFKSKVFKDRIRCVGSACGPRNRYKCDEETATKVSPRGIRRAVFNNAFCNYRAGKVGVGCSELEFLCELATVGNTSVQCLCRDYLRQPVGSWSRAEQAFKCVFATGEDDEGHEFTEESSDLIERHALDWDYSGFDDAIPSEDELLNNIF